MRLRNLVQDDDAVSPVIGVILMVAITVILAAVIASFVLGLGNQAGGVAPQANFQFDYDPGTETVEITHTGGDNVIANEVVLRGDQISGLTNNNWYENATGSDGTADAKASSSDNMAGESAIVSGDSWDVQLDTGSSATPSAYVIRVVWEDADGDTTSELAVNRGPDA